MRKGLFKVADYGDVLAWHWLHSVRMLRSPMRLNGRYQRVP